MGFCPRCQTEYSERSTCPVHAIVLADAADLERLGRHVGSFELTAVLGRGGMATVYEAQALDGADAAAVKILHAPFGEPAAEILRAVEPLVGWTHPGVVSIRDAGFAEDLGVFFRMELVEGPTLGDVLHEEGPLEPEVALELLKRVAASLSKLHEVGYVHRDLKPDNLLLNGGDPREPRLLDVPDAAVADVLLDQGVVRGNFGTPQYMAPEVARGRGAEARSDLYALGVVYFEILTGRRPFDGDDPAEVLRAQVEDAPPLSSADLPKPSREILTALLQKAPGDRPASLDSLC